MITTKQNREWKYDRQNIIDYVLTMYGNVNYLFDFMADNNITSLQQFIIETKKNSSLIIRLTIKIKLYSRVLEILFI